MKHFFLFLLMVWATLGVCNCKNDLSPSHVTQTETGQEQGQQLPQKGEAGEDETIEVVPPVVEPPKVTQPVAPPVVAPQEIVPQEVFPPQEVEDQEGEENETTEIETQEKETPEVEMPELALLQINELRTEFSTTMKNVEYIEFKVIKGGNLEGLYVYIINDPIDPFIYEFPPVDVETGEYITLHLRTLDKNNSCDELRGDLKISGGADACPTARDLWVTGNNKWLYKTDIVYIQDDDGTIFDAVVINEKPSKEWSYNLSFYDEVIEDLYDCGMWQSADGSKPTPLDAVNTSAIGTSVYKSVSRYEGKENTHSIKDWYITSTGSLTPGQPNR